jgi:hypothetical protein
MRAITCIAIAVAAVAGIAREAEAAPTTIDFEDAALDQDIGIHYIAKGVELQTAFIDTADGHRTTPTPHGGTHLAHHFQAEFASAPVSMIFAQGVSSVSFWGGSSEGGSIVGIARAYDATTGGRLIATDGPRALVSGQCATQFSVTVGGATIKRVEFAAQTSTGVLVDIGIDDLSFTGNTPATVPTDTPVVTITSSSSGSFVDATSATLTGTVIGNGLLSQVAVSIEHLRAPGDLAPADSTVLALTGTGTTRTFSGPVRLPLGGVTITVMAKNSGGLEGKTSVSFTNLPAQARDTVGNLGPLAWGVSSATCRIGVYASGALATDGTHQYRIDVTMLSKWTAWYQAKVMSSVDAGTFCPTENQHATLASTIGQSYRGGRIYYDPVRGALFTPLVFMTAIDTLGGEAATGVPLDDPATAPAAHTWLLQRFTRGPSGLPSTLEIKGSPAVLWVERTGGDLGVLNDAKLTLSASTATIVEQFPCSGNTGPCNVVKSTSGARVAGAKDKFCKGTTFALEPPPGGPDEWVPITGSHTQAVQALSWVTSAGPAIDDDGATHEFRQQGPNGHVWADWDMQVAPLDPYRNLLATNNSLEVEVEYYPAQHFYVIDDGFPAPGDLYFAAGRWIIDCGHDDFASEIHPPFVSARIRTIGGASNPQTQAAIWVNGYYRGDAPVEFLLYPPPRPAPNAYMTISRTRTQDGAVGVTVIDASAPDFTDPDFSSYVRARFSATQRSADIGWAGLLPFKSGREYEGYWTIGWQVASQFPVAKLSQTWWP